MQRKLTKKLIDSFNYDSGNGKNDIRWDSEIVGFGVRLYPSGKKSFVISYRYNNKKRLMALGQYGKLTLDKARDIAKKRFGEIADGKDPLAAKQASKKKSKWTVKNSFESYLNSYARKRNKSWSQIKRAFDADILPLIENLSIEEVTKDHIHKIIDNILARDSRIMANRTLAYLKKFLSWCVERSLIEISPAMNISMPSAHVSRDRVLTDKEIKEIWKASENEGYPFGRMLQLLILTAQRRGEVANMEWSEVDFKRKLWSIPKEKTKNGRSNEVPLSEEAITILKSAPKLGNYIFTASGKRPFENFTRGKNSLDEKLNIDSWTIHDIRRTVASGMAALNTPPHIVEKILNHSSGRISGVAAIYNRYEYSSEKREALEKWENHIKGIIK